MHTQFRILEVSRGHVLAQPLDAAKQESLSIASASKYIENEIIVAEPLSVGPGVPSRWEVIASRVDPSFIGGEVPKLAPIDEKNEENEYEFTEYVGYKEGGFRRRFGDPPIGPLRECGASFSRFHQEVSIPHRLVSSTRHHRIRSWSSRSGFEVFPDELSYRSASVPENFDGRLPWIHLENRPCLRSAHGYGLALEQKRRHLEAVDVYEQILAMNPDDNQGIRYLLPSLYLKAQAPQKAKAALEQHGADGMNLYNSVPTRGTRWPPPESRALGMSRPVIQSPPSRDRAGGEEGARFPRGAGRGRGQ